jgi:hypothetical protein
MDALNTFWTFVSDPNHLAAFGGITALLSVLGAIIAWAAKILSDRSIERHKSSLNSDLETHRAALGRETERLKGELTRQGDSFRLQLKKQELMFDKELQATSAFLKLRRDILPTVDTPDFEWEDACQRVAGKFSEYEASFTAFEIAHGAVLSKSVRLKINACKNVASNYKFNGLEDEPEMSWQARKKAGEMIEALAAIEEDLVRAIRTWEP